MAPEILANFILPFVVYDLLAPHYNDTISLMASTIPPVLWSGFELIKTRRLDAVSVLVVAGILFTVIATAMGGSAKLIQIRDALVTGAIGLMFLFSLFLEKPMIFYLNRAMMARNTEQGATDFEAMWARPGVPPTFRLLTAVWGIGLVAQTALMCWLAWTWPIKTYLLLSPFISYGIFGLIMAWSLWYIARRKASAARLAA